jgi:hypothetical protein
LNGGPLYYADLLVNSSGKLTIVPSSGELTLPSNLSTSSGDLFITPSGGDVGINKTFGVSLTRAFEINDTGGLCLRLTNNDASASPTNYVDLFADASGKFKIRPSGDAVGVNITYAGTLTHAFEINDAGGDCLRLIRNDDSGSPVDYADLTVDSFGNLFLNPSGGTVAFPGTLHAWSNFYLLPTAVGVGIKINTGITLTHSLEINDTSGDCLRLIYNDSTGSPANYVDFSVNSSGELDINSSGNVVKFTDTEELQIIGVTASSGVVMAPTGWSGTRINKLELLGELTNSLDSTIVLQNSSNSNTNGGILEFHKSRGTVNVPLTINSGDKLGSVRGIGYDGTSFESSSAPVLRFIASEAFTPTTRGSKIELMTTIIGGTNNQVRMVVQDDGICDFKVGITLPNGGSTLDNMEIGTSYTQNWGDIYPANVPATAYVERHGKKVNMQYTGFSGTTKGSSPGADLNGTAVTHAPKSTIDGILTKIVVGGTSEIGVVTILVTTGYVTINRLDGSNFPTSTVVSVNAFSLSYQTT